ncbi:MAG: hypothetical protein ACEROO_12930, partial [Candidatus Bathyarchaeota archaeon]
GTFGKDVNDKEIIAAQEITNHLKNYYPHKAMYLNKYMMDTIELYNCDIDRITNAHNHEKEIIDNTWMLICTISIIDKYGKTDALDHL